MDWTERFKTQPRPVQLREFEEHRDEVSRALHWQQRSGKTKTMVDFACYHYEQFAIDAVVVLAPNNVHANWVRRELPKHMWDGIHWGAMAWSRTQSWNVQYEQEFERLITHKGLAWLSVNVQALADKRAREWLASFCRVRRYAVIVDEVHEFRSHTSARFRNAVPVARKAVLRRTLSGTMADNSPLHLYPQFELLEKAALGYDSFEKFKAHFAKVSVQDVYIKGKKRRLPQIVGFKNQEELRERVSRHTSFVSREEAGLPPLLVHREEFELTQDQKNLYNAVCRGAIARLDGGEIIPPYDGGVLLTRLQQITSGFAVDEDKIVHDLMPYFENPRLLWLGRQIDNLPPNGKFIVWCRFQKDVRNVLAFLKAREIEAVDYYGPTPAKQRAVNEDRFRRVKRVRGFVGQPLSAGVGLDLSAADDIFWYSYLPGDLIARRQADERATEAGGRSVVVTELVALGTNDEKFLDDLEGKAGLTDYLVGEGLREWLRLVH